MSMHQKSAPASGLEIQTGSEVKETLRLGKTLFFEEFLKWVVKSVFLACLAVLVALFTPFWSNVGDIWNTPAYIELMESERNERFDSIENTLEEVLLAIKDLRGDNRVISQESGLSYVEEPVSVGEDVNIIVVAERTEYGKHCTIKDSQSIFMDTNRIPTPGQRALENSRRNINTDPSVIPVQLVPPANLKPGRIEVYLILEYSCPIMADGVPTTNFKTVFDKTDTLVYELLE